MRRLKEARFGLEEQQYSARVTQPGARAGLRYAAETYSGNAKTFKLPSYTVADAGLSIAMTARLRINLLDKVYATTTYNDEQWLLGPPRSLDLTLDTKF
jgi:iron complex outermembrane receptor protein